MSVTQCCQHCQVWSNSHPAARSGSAEIGSFATKVCVRRAARIAGSGVWRSLVARSVRVGEAPSSNLGTPIATHTARGAAGETDGLPRRGAVVCRSPLCSVARWFRQLSSTSTSPLRSPGPTWDPRATRSSGAAMGWRSTPTATTRRAAPRSRSWSCTPSSITTTRSGCCSPSASSRGWAGSATPTRRRWRWSDGGANRATSSSTPTRDRCSRRSPPAG